METTTIRYLDTKRTVDVEVEVSGLRVGWGDRRSDAAASEPLPVWTEQHQLRWDVLLERGTDGRLYEAADQNHPMREALLRARKTVSRAADVAERADPEIAEAVARYAELMREIDAELADDAEYEKRRRVDAMGIARAFRRASVKIGEQTVPGKACVRSNRGKLLGYADVWDCRWLGTVERI
jgi:hypothetical protein